MHTLCIKYKSFALFDLRITQKGTYVCMDVVMFSGKHAVIIMAITLHLVALSSVTICVHKHVGVCA